MLEKPSMTLRIATGKTTGFAFGLAGFLLLPQMPPGVDPLIRWGILLWYTTPGAIIAVFGVYTWHPVLRLLLPWPVWSSVTSRHVSALRAQPRSIARRRDPGWTSAV
jgi:hypothetical protein